jgi:hypothetical protein
MSVSRRKFLKNSAVAAAAFVAAPLPAAWSGVHEPSADLIPAGHMAGSISIFDRLGFEKAVGSAFQVSAAGNLPSVWMTLLAVKDLPALVPVNTATMAVLPPRASAPLTTSGFMLTFHTSAAPMAQGVYTLEHHILGKFDLLLVPGGQGANTYTAVFNTLVPSTAVHFRPPVAIRRDLGASGSGAVGGSGGPVSHAAPPSSPSSPSSFRGPAEQQVEPVFRYRLETKLPE